MEFYGMVMQGARASAAMVLTVSYQDIPVSVPTGPDSKVYGANMGSNWGRHDPGGPHVGPMNLGIWGVSYLHQLILILLRCWMCYKYGAM